MNRKAKVVLLTIAASLSLQLTTYATNECTYTSLPVDWKFTEQGFVWYKQSDYQSEDSMGYWKGFSGVYRGRATSMPRPTNSGCGPISMAIIVTNCKQEMITPAETIQYYCDTGLYTGNGTSHNSGIQAAKHYGLSYEIPNTVVHSDRTLDMATEVAWMRKHLEQGHWIQILVKGTPNIKNSIWPHAGGHYVAIHGYQDGNTFVYDSSREYMLEEEYNLEEVWKNIRHPLVDGCGSKNHMTAIW